MLFCAKTPPQRVRLTPCPEEFLIAQPRMERPAASSKSSNPRLASTILSPPSKTMDSSVTPLEPVAWSSGPGPMSLSVEPPGAPMRRAPGGSSSERIAVTPGSAGRRRCFERRRLKCAGAELLGEFAGLVARLRRKWRGEAGRREAEKAPARRMRENARSRMIHACHCAIVAGGRAPSRRVLATG